MKKLLIWVFCVVLLLSLTACGEDETGTTKPDNPDTTVTGEADPSVTEGDTTATEGDATTTTSATKEGETTTSTKKGDGTTKPQPSDNSVDWDQYFGDDTTTSATKKGETTTTTTTTTKKTTSTTKATGTTKPIEIADVVLPALGTDVDGRGRIAVQDVDLNKGVMSILFRNNTDKQTQKWITEETNYITYACYDKDGKELTGKDAHFGYFYIGCLEAGNEIEFKVTLPEGTVKVALTGAKIVYWTPWS